MLEKDRQGGRGLLYRKEANEKPRTEKWFVPRRMEVGREEAVLGWWRGGVSSKGCVCVHEWMESGT